eukprot:CAMPEP_0204386000 /NCGR_PEP_ID=MMETSP0469-20131031/58097_1 /ASSEMBLY_ACC=CAM_ASM_000384 /TAXON_ID=2969 /ORGANISM="Oxyrrhis marina" /LENGTH=530 /DNA_ID=CAMNT_0051379123 /DNA_START=41 /DNA_END=1633 /DNA_ORIENTATION=-
MKGVCLAVFTPVVCASSLRRSAPSALSHVSSEHVVITDHINEKKKANSTADAATYSDAQLMNIWVPVSLPQHSTYYLNPVTAEEATAPPQGAIVTKEAAVSVDEAGAVDSHTPREPLNEHGMLVPESERLSCVPHCTWNCTQPVCEQDCEPVCHRPKCETRCPKPTNPNEFSECGVHCDKPQCKMFCPKDICEGRKTLDCQRPKCNTRCEEPQCRFICNAALSCKTLCPDPVCEFKCKKPQECPKPECRMICEKPPQCDDVKKPTVAPVSEGEVVASQGKAEAGSASWVSEPWGVCSTTCGTGKKTRSVHCSSGHDGDCHEDKPEASAVCEEYSGCEWIPGEWSKCPARCGSGRQTRTVSCSGKKCLKPKPTTEQACTHDGPECTGCKATVFGGPNFDGWSLELPQGDYTSSDLELKGAKCDDISSLKIFGVFCHAVGYQYGDFNKQHDGWKADFPYGEYKTKDMVQRGARDNDISSIKVFSESGRAGSTTQSNVSSTGVTHWPGAGPRYSGAGATGAAAALVLAAAFWC